ncbi:MAG: hypothetical protein ACM3TR_18280 [Caulobacteraceae bacterium]
MKISKLSYKAILSFVLILSLLNFAACSPQKKPATPKKGNQAEEKEPPKELDKLKSSIEKVEKALKSIYEESKKPMFIQQEKVENPPAKQGGQQESSGQQSDGQQGGGGSQGGGSSQGQQGQQGQQSQQQQKLTPEQIKLKLEQEKYKNFDSIKKDVISLHSAWNSYEPKAIADFAMQSSVNDFESALNNLTKTVDMQDAYMSLLEVNQLYKFLPDFYMLYKGDVPPDLDRIRFAVKKIQLLADKDDYAGANDVLLYLENVWTSTRPKLKQDNIQMMSKFEFALSDLKNSIISKNKMVVQAKSEVLLKLVDDIEKAAGKSKKQS